MFSLELTLAKLGYAQIINSKVSQGDTDFKALMYRLATPLSFPPHWWCRVFFCARLSFFFGWCGIEFRSRRAA